MTTVVIGAQWGDEGKGKIVDFLASQADDIVRFSGGANAGHTIVHGGTTYKLHLVPSGILYPDTQVLLGVGMVIDVASLFGELEELEQKGVRWRGRVHVSDRAHVVLPGYSEEDRELDTKRRRPIGTTGRGIGVAYARKAARDGLRVCDVVDDLAYRELPESERRYFEPYRDELSRMAIDLSEYMIARRGRRILFEGAQGVLLDLDLGTYPFVSSGTSAAAGAALGGGLGPRGIDRVLGVFKAYSTRVGNGPFPSEFRADRDGGLEEHIRERGAEYGATTGRPRRCGYLDLVALRYACRSNSIDGLVMTKLDVYDDAGRIGVCTGYRYGNQTLKTVPAGVRTLESVEPVIEEMPGWQEPLGDRRSFDELPAAARNYVQMIEDYVETPVDIISVGSDRSETIIRKEPWTQ